MTITPAQINTEQSFADSVWGSRETETVARNLVLLAKNKSLSEWTPFTWEDYVQFCTHYVTQSERGVLNALVSGGRPVSNTLAYLQSGYLELRDNAYHFTPKFLRAVEPFRIT